MSPVHGDLPEKWTLLRSAIKYDTEGLGIPSFLLDTATVHGKLRLALGENGLARLLIPVDVRERLPEGAAAVILNPAHTYTDIYLPVDEFEDRLLNVIDGERSINSILQEVTGDSASRDRVRGFFEQLWSYDQVVFDASKV